MIKEYYKFIKDYLKLSQTKASYFIAMVVTAIGYKVFLVLNVLFASWIINIINYYKNKRESNSLFICF